MTRKQLRAHSRTVLVTVVIGALGCRDDPLAPVVQPHGDDMVATATATPVMPVDLGTPGAASGSAIDINDAGIVVGSMRNAAGTTTYVRWLGNGALDTVPLVAVAGIGNDGSVGGQATPCNAGRWVPGVGVTTAPSLVPGGCMRVYAVSPSGGVIAGSADTIPAPPFLVLQNAFTWTPASIPPNRVTAIPSFPPYRFAAAYGVNGSATAVGSIMRTGPQPMEQAFVAHALAPITLTGSSPCRALAINGSGTVVGVQSGRAVRFYPGTPSVDDLLPGVASSTADAINDKGEIVINAGSQAYLLRGATLVPLAGLGGTMVHASAVNERSQVVGWAYDAQGVQRPVMWDLNPPLVAFAGGPYAGIEGMQVLFSGNATGAGTSPSYAWSFGDGLMGAGANTSHAYADNGTYDVTFTVTDGARQASAGTIATIANATPTIDMAPGGTVYSGETFVVRARFDDAGVNDAPWRWRLLDQDSTLLASGAATIAPDSILVPVTLARAGTYWLSLALTDKDGGGTGGLVRLDVLRLPMPMDVAPSSLHAAQRGNGLLTVTLFATPAVDPSRIDVRTVRLGRVLAPAARGKGQPMATLDDVNGDGVMELVLKFERADARAVLTGSGGALVLQADLVDGRQVEGRWTWPPPAAGQ